MPKTLKDLQRIAVKFRQDRNWKQFHGPKDGALGLMMEVGEFAEHFVYYQDDDLLKRIQENKEEIGRELSDVLYWVLLISHDLGINLETAFPEKMKLLEKKYPLPPNK